MSDVDTLSGTVSGTAGTITITAQLYNNGTAVGAAKTAQIVFSTEEKDDEKNPNYPVSGNSSSGEPYAGVPTYEGDDTNILANTEADPDSTSGEHPWDGKDPVFGTKGGNAKKEKPKIATSKPSFVNAGANAKALTSGTADSFKVEIKGPSPAINVYVAAKDAIKLGWLAKGATTNIQLTKENIKKYAIPFRVTSYDISKATAASQDKNTTHSVTIAYNGAHVAYKGFPITVAAENNDTGSKPVTKTYKIDINSGRSVPQWIAEDGIASDHPDLGKKDKTPPSEIWTKKNTADVSVCFTDGETVSNTFTVSGDAPYSITQKGLKADSGLTVTVTSPDLNKWGEVVTPGYVTISGAFTAKDNKDKLKEHKAAITMTATGSVKKAAAKANIIGKISPYFDAKKTTSKDVDGETRVYLTGIKRVEAGKVPSVKFAAKGSKTITYSIDEDSLLALNDVGLSFDTKKGAVVALDSKNKAAIIPTIGEIEYTYTDDEGEEHTGSYTVLKSIDICVTATNGVGTDAVAYAEVAVTGAKPKFDTKKLTISRDEIAEKADGYVLYDFPIELRVDENSEYQECTFSFADTKSSTDLAAVGLGLYVNEGESSTSAYLKIVDASKIKATKGVKININANCYGAVAKGGITVSIADPAPVISGDSAIAFTSLSKDTTGKTITLGLTEAPTGDTKLQWKLTTKPTNKAVGTKFTAAKDGKSATLNVTIKSDLTAALSDKAVITVTNSNTKQSGTFEVAITAAKTTTNSGAHPGNVGSAPEAEEAEAEEAEAEEAEAEDEAEEAEEDALVIGAPRTAANLTAGQKAFLANNGYTVVAVLPEVTANVEGQQEFEVELSEEAPEGAKLIWLAFPQGTPETEDDKIADFYDEAGAPIEEVPAGKTIVVAPWLRAGVTYQPVIAVEDAE